MIRAGNFTIQDNGFAVETVSVGGTSRQAIIAELPGGISDKALAAFCAGPIDVLDETGAVVQTHTGPFSILSHGLKLARTSADGDVAVLSARVTDLEAELKTANNAKENANRELASLSEQLKSLQVAAPTVNSPKSSGETGGTVNANAGSL
ncbi:MAG: hypothetical protein RR949_04715 [Oscillospiraceae bacterium]